MTQLPQRENLFTKVLKWVEDEIESEPGLVFPLRVARLNLWTAETSLKRLVNKNQAAKNQRKARSINRSGRKRKATGNCDQRPVVHRITESRVFEGYYGQDQTSYRSLGTIHSLKMNNK